MYKGSCLCGKIELEITGPIEAIIHCHCSKCRKSTGSAFSTNGFVANQYFKIKKGKDTLGNYETLPGKNRYFCSTCASPIYSSSDTSPGYVRLRLGILDSDITERPMSHNFVTSKANWEKLNATLPEHEKHEPDRHYFANKK